MGQEIAGRKLKRMVLDLVQAEDFDKALDELLALPGRQVINPLFLLLLHKEEMVRWRTVTAMGAVLEKLAETDPEGARIIMRRLMWSLNEESGGIGWGATEVMGEAMARSEPLSREFSSMLVSYLTEGANFLEYEALQRGLLWAVGRLAGMRPEAVKEATPHLEKFFQSSDPAVRGLAAWAAGFLKMNEASAGLRALVHDTARLQVYVNGRLIPKEVADLAVEALGRIEGEDRVNGA